MPGKTWLSKVGQNYFQVKIIQKKIANMAAFGEQFSWPLLSQQMMAIIIRDEIFLNKNDLHAAGASKDLAY